MTLPDNTRPIRGEAETEPQASEQHNPNIGALAAHERLDASAMKVERYGDPA